MKRSQRIEFGYGRFIVAFIIIVTANFIAVFIIPHNVAQAMTRCVVVVGAIVFAYWVDALLKLGLYHTVSDGPIGIWRQIMAGLEVVMEELKAIFSKKARHKRPFFHQYAVFDDGRTGELIYVPGILVRGEDGDDVFLAISSTGSERSTIPALVSLGEDDFEGTPCEVLGPFTGRIAYEECAPPTKEKSPESE